MRFDRYTENILQGFPAPQIKLIRSYGQMYDDALYVMALRGPRQGAGGDLKITPNDVNLYEKLDRQALSVIGQLVADGANESEGVYLCEGTPRDRKLINKAAIPFAEKLGKAVPMERHIPMWGARSQEMALGFIGVHYAIWSPAEAIKKPAATYLDMAQTALIETFAKPLNSLHKRYLPQS